LARAGNDGRERVDRAVLLQMHLPKLTGIGGVAYDADESVVRLNESSGVVECLGRS